jgi:hypothetical protein
MMPLGHFPRVWWTTGPVPVVATGSLEIPGPGTRTPPALRAQRARRCLQRNRTTQPLLSLAQRLSTNAGLDPRVATRPAPRPTTREACGSESLLVSPRARQDDRVPGDPLSLLKQYVYP